jgi:hypothetical protein
MPAPRESEATGTPVAVEYAGKTYTVIPQPWPAKLLRLIESEKFVAALTVLLGEEQYAAFEDVSSMEDIALLLTAIGEAVGADPT